MNRYISKNYTTTKNTIDRQIYRARTAVMSTITSHKYNENTLVLWKREPGVLKTYSVYVSLTGDHGNSRLLWLQTCLEFLMVLQYNLCVVKA